MVIQDIDDIHEGLNACISSMDTCNSLLFIVETEHLFSVIVEATKDLLARDKYGIYVSLNKPHKTIEKGLKKEGVDTEKIYFIDCVTSLAHDKLSKNRKKVYYAADPADIDDDGGIPKGIEHFTSTVAGEKFIILDALRTMLLYNEPEIISTFIHNLIHILKSKNTKLVVLTPKNDEKLIELVKNGFDGVYRL